MALVGVLRKRIARDSLGKFAIFETTALVDTKDRRVSWCVDQRLNGPTFDGVLHSLKVKTTSALRTNHLRELNEPLT